MKISKALQTIIIIAGMALSFILVLLAKSMKIDDGQLIWNIDWTSLANVTFWILTVAVALCITFCYVGFYTLTKNKLLKSEEFQKYVNEYNDKIKLKGPNFDEYIRLNNLKEKKSKYVNKMTIKLNKYKYKLACISNEDLNSKKGMYIKNMINKLEYQLSDEFIENNLLGIKVKYTELHANNFRENAYSNLEDSRKDHSKESLKLTLSTAKKFCTSIISACIFAVFVVNAIFVFHFNANFWTIMVSTIFSALMNAYFGAALANKYYQSEYLLPIMNKTDILKKYIVWNSEHGGQYTSYNDILDNYYKKRIEAEREDIKQEYKEKVDNIENKFKEIKQNKSIAS